MEEHEGSWFISPGGEIVAGDFGKALFALIDAGGIESQTAQSTVPPPDGVLAGLTYGVWTLPDGVRPAPTILVEPGAYQLGAASICIQDDGDPTGRTLLQVLTPDRESQLGSYSSRDEGWKVVWGQPNELSLPVWTGPLLMLDRALACAPPMDAVTLHLSRPVALRSDFRRQKRATQGDRVDIRISGARYGAPSPSRERLERPTKLLDGVEVLSYRPLNIPTPERMRTQYELRVLLTPEERALLFQLQSYLEAAVVDPETERTSLDAEVRRQVEERFELTGSS
jgi:hypothetical protein